MEKVTQLFPSPLLPSGKDIGAHFASLSVPIGLGDTKELAKALEAESLLSDSRALWLTYPSLSDASDKLIATLSVGWPSQSGKYPAAIQAILTAIRKVQEGLTKGESTREYIVVNYLTGLGSVVSDVALTQVWGFQNNRVIEQWTASSPPFVEWANNYGFDEIRFYRRTAVPAHELDGTRLKLLCAVASARDIGVMSRYR